MSPDDFVIENGSLVKYTGSESKVVIPGGVAVIKSLAFNKNKNIVEVDVPKGVKIIEDSAFFGCTRLETVTIGETVEAIGSSAFYGAIFLREICVDKGSKHFSSDGGVLFDKDMKTLISCPKSKFGKYAIPQSVENIKDLAFDSCASITEIVIPPSVKAIGDKVFWGCARLKDVNIHSGITSIGKSAFYNCAALKKVTIPSGVSSVGAGAFGYCFYINAVILEEGVKEIKGAAFRDCFRLESVKLPESLESIGDNAFYNCYKLKEVRIPKNVKTLGADTFGYCRELRYFKTEAEALDFVSFSTIAAFDENKVKVCLCSAPDRDTWLKLDEEKRLKLIRFFLNSISEASETVKGIYGGYIAERKMELIPLLTKNTAIDQMQFFAKEGIIDAETYQLFMDCVRDNAEVTAWLMDYCNTFISAKEKDDAFDRAFDEIMNL